VGRRCITLRAAGEGPLQPYTKEWLLGSLVIFLAAGPPRAGVRAGEVTAGAANDIERATNVARRMVTQFRDERLDRDDGGGRPGERSFWAARFSSGEVSERTAKAVDGKNRL
jgi:ATP-dependent Zn protease